MGTISYGATGSDYVTDAARRYRTHGLFPRDPVIAPKRANDAYVCHFDEGKIRWHFPMHGNTLKRGERHMRADDCIYCGTRIVSLHVGAMLEERTFDSWRTASSVRPSTIIEEDPI
jgi:hypothetical protein